MRRSVAGGVLWTILFFYLAAVDVAQGKKAKSHKTRVGSELKLSDEKRLVNNLLRSYSRVGKMGRPVVNTSEAVCVTFGLGLIQLDVDEKNNMLSLSTWVRYHWRDEYLQWDPHLFGGVNQLKLPHQKIWTPDIMLYNTANTEEYIRSALLIVSYDGMVQWYPHRLYQSACAFDVRNFPFDNQTCHLAFGSWTHNMQELNLTLFENGLDLSTFQSDYKDSSKWDITDIEGHRQTVDELYGVLSFTIKLRRKLMFSSYILTVPAVFLAFLTLIVFVLPADDVEKPILGLTIFGSLLLLLLILVEAAPPTASAVPLLGLFYCFTTVIVILSVFLSAFVVKLGNTDKQGKRRRVPDLVKKVMFRGVARFILMEPLYLESSNPDEKNNSSISLNGRKNSKVCRSQTPELPYTPGNVSRDSETERDGFFQNFKMAPEEPDSIDSLLTISQRALAHTVHKQLKHISAVLNRVALQQQGREERESWEKDIHSEWKYLAAVLDRLFFIIYFIAIVVSLGVLFPRPSG